MVESGSLVLLKGNRAWVWSHLLNLACAGRQQVELWGLEKETGTASDVWLESMDLQAILL